jgi:pimeloyl-ACP methyl ester carboxylesterase
MFCLPIAEPSSLEPGIHFIRTVLAHYNCSEPVIVENIPSPLELGVLGNGEMPFSNDEENMLPFGRYLVIASTLGTLEDSHLFAQYITLSFYVPLPPQVLKEQMSDYHRALAVPPPLLSLRRKPSIRPAPQIVVSRRVLVMAALIVSLFFQDEWSYLNAQTMIGKEPIVRMHAGVTGKGRPIVLIPGGLTGWLSWIPHAERLSANRKVVRVQLLNVQFGLDNKPLPTDYSVKMESRALAATIDSLHLEKQLDLVAWSYGAMTTLDYALDNPERVRTLTLIEPPALWVLRAKGALDADTRKVVALLETRLDTVKESDLEAFAQNVGLLRPSEKGSSLPQWPIWMQHRFSLRNNPFVIAHTDDTARLVAFTPPVLLVKGTGSAKFLHQIIDGLAGYLPHAEVVEFPGGHAPQIVSMDRFLQKLQTFQSSATTGR